jgi:uncharacterized protein (DUF1330 family)
MSLQTCPANAADGFESGIRARSKSVALHGSSLVARGTAAKAYEKGLSERVVIVEFDSVEKAIAVHDGAAYQAALKALGNSVERDLRIVEGLA